MKKLLFDILTPTAQKYVETGYVRYLLKMNDEDMASLWHYKEQLALHEFVAYEIIEILTAA